MDYYYTDSNNQTNGPVSLDQLRSLALSGTLNASTMIAPLGSQQWSPIGTLIPTVAPAPNRPNEPLASWSFVLSLFGLFCCGFIVAIPAIICGHLALSNIGKKPHLQGKGLAIAGLIIGYVGFAFWLLHTVFFGGIAFLSIIAEGMK